jgi:glycerol-3-phosphate dehydrogenase
MSESLIDGVQRSPPNGIRVIVVGAGIGGLGVALECWQKGCEVVVLERADKLSPLGNEPTSSSARQAYT